VPNDARTPVVVVAGLAATAAQDVADALLEERTAIVHHDVAQLCDGVLIRNRGRLRWPLWRRENGGCVRPGRRS
jgi:threonine dehydratase